MKGYLCRLLFVALSILFLLTPSQPLLATPVSDNGWLSVRNSHLVNQEQIPIQLKGMSSHGIQWYGKFVTYNTLKQLRDTWNLSVFRTAMYLNEGGYMSHPELKNKMIEAVDSAISLGIYVIIDWHILSERDPNTYRDQALVFFEEMANRYHGYPNVLYEIANEPNNTSWPNNIRPYAIALASKIRSIDSHNIIIVGTNQWSQSVDEAANNPLPSEYTNIMYTCHFYAGSHGSWLRDQISQAMSKGIAIFITEWGVTDYSGNGNVYLNESRDWLNFLTSKKVSWATWSFSDHSESSAVLTPGTDPNSLWTDDHLKASGRFVKSMMLN